MNNQRRPEYVVPALIAGVVVGVLSGIPLVCCLSCLWIIGGAILASHLLAKNTAGVLTAGDGAIVGALTGIAAAVVHTFLEISPLGEINRNFFLRLAEKWVQASGQALPQLEDLRQLGAKTGMTIAGFFFSLFIWAAIFAVLGVLGGVIGVSLFGRKKTPAPPQPPQGPRDAAA